MVISLQIHHPKRHNSPEPNGINIMIQALQQDPDQLLSWKYNQSSLLLQFHLTAMTPWDTLANLYKYKTTFRFAFINQNALSLARMAMADFTAMAKELDINWLGVVETLLDLGKTTSKSSSRHTFNQQMVLPLPTVFFLQAISTMAAIISTGEFYNSQRIMPTRTISKFSDQLGRFTSQSHIGRNGQILTTIAAYWVCDGNSGPFQQQHYRELCWLQPTAAPIQDKQSS